MVCVAVERGALVLAAVCGLLAPSLTAVVHGAAHAHLAEAPGASAAHSEDHHAIDGPSDQRLRVDVAGGHDHRHSRLEPTVLSRNPVATADHADSVDLPAGLGLGALRVVRPSPRRREELARPGPLTSPRPPTRAPPRA